jgi:hypothetical protein
VHPLLFLFLFLFFEVGASKEKENEWTQRNAKKRRRIECEGRKDYLIIISLFHLF